MTESQWQAPVGPISMAVNKVTQATKALTKAKGPTAILYAQIKLAQAQEALDALMTPAVA